MIKHLTETIRLLPIYRCLDCTEFVANAIEDGCMLTFRKMSHDTALGSTPEWCPLKIQKTNEEIIKTLESIKKIAAVMDKGKVEKAVERTIRNACDELIQALRKSQP